MGRVFSWDDIANNRVPVLSSFQDIAETMKTEIFVNPSILGGLLFGSVLWGCHNHRSDLDFLVVYDSAASYNVLSRLRKIKMQAYKLFVPLSIIAIDNRLAASPYHSINPLFAKHLGSIARQGGVIKKNPLEFFSFDGSDDLQHFRSYMQFRLRFLIHDLMAFDTMSAAAQYKYFQKMLESPVHIARKVLTLSDCDMENDSRNVVVEKYLDLIGHEESGMPQLFRELVGCDSQYNADLVEQLAHPNEKEYGQVISKIKLEADRFYRFARQVALSFEV